MQIVFAIAVSMKWQANSTDIRAAFLQGKQININVFIKPPKEAGSVMLWKLNKTVYRPTDAARKWYLKVKEELIATGCTICKYDEALFFQKVNGELHGIICCHVDEFCLGGSKLFKVEVIDLIKKKFEISKEDISVFQYLGLNISQHQNEIQVHQHDYTNCTEKLTIPESRLKNDPLNEDQSHQLWVLAAQPNCLSNQTHPDIAFNTCRISVYIHKAAIKELCTANKTVKPNLRK